MAQPDKIRMQDIKGNLKTYFNWSANALLGGNPVATDRFLRAHYITIQEIAQELLRRIEYAPGPVYRGIILREEVEVIEPHPNFSFLSFSTSWEVADHFADIHGFGSNLVEVSQQLGTHGYIIHHTPEIQEVLFHHDLLSVLPYDEAYRLLGMDGEKEMRVCRQQCEVIILQPAKPFTHFEKKRSGAI